MTLVEILKSQGLQDEQIEKIVGEMKQNKIYTAGEENLDVRYGKLKTDHDALVAKDTESQKLIAELQKASKGQEDIQNKIAEYEQTIKNQQEELEHTKIESALKVSLLGAKATDIDYLAFKVKEKNSELKLDADGNIKGINDMIADLRTEFPNQFESSTHKKFEEKKLPDKTDDNEISKETFDKMGYQEKVKLFNENPEVYNELNK